MPRVDVYACVLFVFLNPNSNGIIVFIIFLSYFLRRSVDTSNAVVVAATTASPRVLQVQFTRHICSVVFYRLRTTDYGHCTGLCKSCATGDQLPTTPTPSQVNASSHPSIYSYYNIITSCTIDIVVIVDFSTLRLTNIVR